MTLTEEQRAAIKIAIRYIPCWPSACKERYAKEVLQAMIDSSDHIVEIDELIGFDLEKARAEVATASARRFSESREQARIFCAEEILPDALDEIERLRASLIDLHAEYINTLEKNPECSAWDLDEQSDADQRRLRKNAAHAISITEPPIYLQAEQLAARIKELEDALVEERARVITSHPLTHVIDEDRTEASMQLQAEGKIGPDAETGNRDHVVGPDQMVPNGKVLQITEERKAAIDRGLQFLEWSYAKNSAHDTKEQIAVLWAMLEASQ
jgi:hypothetical protein